MSVEETAEVLHVSPDTVKRDWRLAKLWLLRELEGVSAGGQRFLVNTLAEPAAPAPITLVVNWRRC